MSLSDGQYLTRHRRCTVRLQPLFRFDHDRSGRRQLLNLCSPVDGKPSVADLEDYPLADYILSSTPLRKLDDALHRMRSFAAPHCYSRLVRFSWLRASALLPVHDSCLFVFSPSVFLLDVVAPSLLHVTVTTPSSVRVERDSDSRFDKSRFGRLLFSSGHHHVKEQPVPTPATDPVYFPTVDLLAQGGWLTKAQIFRFHLHGLYTPHTSIALWSKTVKSERCTPDLWPARLHSTFAGAK